MNTVFYVIFMILMRITGWLGGVVVKSQTSDSEVASSIPTRTAVEQ